MTDLVNIIYRTIIQARDSHAVAARVHAQELLDELILEAVEDDCQPAANWLRNRLGSRR